VIGGIGFDLLTRQNSWNSGCGRKHRYP
jgi:hypothetical protein